MMMNPNILNKNPLMFFDRAVNAQRSQPGGYTAGNGGLSRAALSRRDHNCSGHRFTPVV